MDEAKSIDFSFETVKNDEEKRRAIELWQMLENQTILEPHVVLKEQEPTIDDSERSESIDLQRIWRDELDILKSLNLYETALASRKQPDKQFINFQTCEIKTNAAADYLDNGKRDIDIFTRNTINDANRLKQAYVIPEKYKHLLQ